LDIFDFFDQKILGDHKKRLINKEFDSEYSQHEESDSFLKDEKGKRNFFGLYMITLFIFGALIVKLWSLQIVQGSHYSYIAEGNRIRTKIVLSSRGVIYAKDGEILVSNIPSFVLEVSAQDLPKDTGEKEKILKKVASWAKLSQKDVLKKVNNSNGDNVILIENIERTEALILKERLADISGVSVEEKATRKYDSQATLAHILGYVGKINDKEYSKLKENDYTMVDYLGKTGLENYYEQILRGKYGKKQVEVDATGKISRILAESEPVSGNNLVLTLDYKLQKKVSQTLEKSFKKAKSPGGSVVALDPRTGAVLAMVSWPSYDNNIFTTKSSKERTSEYQKLATDPNKPLFNRALSGIYPPGSTIKMLVAAAGLQEGIININTYLYAKEAIEIPNKYDPSIVYRYPDWKPGGHGYVNVISSIAKSCDVFFYAVGGGYENIKGLGIDKLYQYFKKFGLGSKSGIDLPNENSGLAPNPEWKEKAKKESWYFGDTYHASIGQGDLLVTPLQLANYVTAIANGGNLMKPHLVWKIQDGEGNVIKEYKKEVKTENLVSRENIEIVRRGMREAVASGTARELRSLPVPAAGKTGTAQFDNNAKTHAWFTAFAPYDNPEIALAVVVDGGGEGHDVAAPIAREILNYYFTRK